MPVTLPIDLDDLTVALTHRDPYTGSHWLFDSRTGALIFVNDGVDPEDLPDDLDDDTRYLRVEAIDSSLSWQIRADFAAQLDDPGLAQRLTAALEQRKPFRRFREVLGDHPRQREAWFAFERVALERHARAWCEERGVTPQWTGFGARAIGLLPPA